MQHRLNWALALDLYLGYDLEIHRELCQVTCPLASCTTNLDSTHRLCRAEATLAEQCQVSPERHFSHVPGLAYPMQPECLD